MILGLSFDIFRAMPKEVAGIGLKYKDQVSVGAMDVAREQDLLPDPRVVRFPRVIGPKADARVEVTQGDYLVVDVARIRRLSTADKFVERDKFSRELLRRLEFISGNDVILKQMAGVDGNLLMEFDHPALPYKAEVLVHNMGDCEYLLSGFVISPK
ncbi:MAG: hypothetical protein UT84_C0007G0006 [Candidatus Curtissbacteria bacterium GW2011_GWA1_40_16]|uniref:Uncharacterized protein n=1 Tax=Candidatus Curtissbacteria bacterium GW2011_GWA1_40_16 TaxID=1618405 RepID=A0A0G0TUI9_9BACT|nr:MAG: hypothetical protein UT84_C0007G0006 [Candidatus Curtissbacteria bacterium GW2011_GWA1_40_16]